MLEGKDHQSIDTMVMDIMAHIEAEKIEKVAVLKAIITLYSNRACSSCFDLMLIGATDELKTLLKIKKGLDRKSAAVFKQHWALSCSKCSFSFYINCTNTGTGIVISHSRVHLVPINLTIFRIHTKAHQREERAN